MNLENRLPDETVNYTDEHPLKEFAWLAGGVIVASIVIVAAVGFFAAEIAARLPFTVERELVASRSTARDPLRDPQVAEAARELDALGRRIAAVMRLEPGMDIDLRLVDTPMVNAFATLGGLVFVHRGLIERMPDENTLALVVAHEIAHVKERHPVRGAGRGVAVGLILAAAGLSGPAGDLAGSAGGLTLLSFSRSQERDADREAVAALNALYGHGGGAKDLFGLLGSQGRPDSSRIAMLQTHPLSAERIVELERHVAAQGWLADGPRTALAPALAKLRDKTPPAKP